MEEFTLPESFEGLSQEELSSLVESAKTEFNELFESDDISTDTLERMEYLANAIETLSNEQDHRVQAAAKRAELSTKVETATAPGETAAEPVEAGSRWYGDDKDKDTEAGSRWYSDAKVVNGSRWYRFGNAWYGDAAPADESDDELGSSWYHFGSRWYKAKVATPDGLAAGDTVEAGSRWYSQEREENGARWYKFGESWYGESDPHSEPENKMGSRWYHFGSRWYKAAPTELGARWYSADEVTEASTEATAEAAAEAIAEVDVEGVIEAAVEEVSVEEAPVEAAVETDVNNTEITDAEEGVLVAANKPNTNIAIPERGPSVVIAAAVDVPQFYVGQRLDKNGLADALHNKARMLSDSRGNQTVYPVATIERPFLPEYDLEGLDQATTWDRISDGTKANALTAAGGWCAPSQIVYDLFETECETGSDQLYKLPTFRVTRGGIRFPVFEEHDDGFDPGFVWTEANDEAATSGSPTKPCVRIPCPTFTEVRLDATGLCVTAGNLIDRAYPEQVRWFLARALRAYERNSSIRQLNAVLGDTDPVSISASFGAAPALLDALLLSAASYRETNGLCCDARLDAVFPCWTKDLLRADIARQQGTLNLGSLPTDAEVDSWFAAVGVNASYVNYWQTIGDAATDWPTSVDFLIGYPGSYVRFDGGRLDIGVMRDSVLNATNDFTAVWFEEFYAIGRRGPKHNLVTVGLCVDGTVGGRNDSGASFAPCD